MGINKGILFTMAFFLMAAGAHAMNNPFLGKRLDDKSNAPLANEAKSRSGPSVMPPIPPAPQPLASAPVPQYAHPSAVKAVPADERVAAWVVKGKVDDDVFLEDANDPIHDLTVKDNSEIEGGCLVRYPEVLCGKAASRAKLEATELEKARMKSAALQAEIAKLRKEQGECAEDARKQADSSARSELAMNSLKKQTEELKAALAKANVSAAASDELLYGLTQKLGRGYKNKDIGSFTMLRTEGQLAVLVSATQGKAAEKVFAGSIVKKVSGVAGTLYVLDASIAVNQAGETL